MTFNINDSVARDFLSLIPNRKRSQTISDLLRKLLEGKKDKIATACKNANKDEKVNKTVDEWQGFDSKIDGEWA